MPAEQATAGVAPTTARTITSSVSVSAWFTLRLAAIVDSAVTRFSSSPKAWVRSVSSRTTPSMCGCPWKVNADAWTCTGKVLPSLRTSTAGERGCSPPSTAAVPRPSASWKSGWVQAVIGRPVSSSGW